MEAIASHKDWVRLDYVNLGFSYLEEFATGTNKFHKVPEVGVGQWPSPYLFIIEENTSRASTALHLDDGPYLIKHLIPTWMGRARGLFVLYLILVEMECGGGRNLQRMITPSNLVAEGVAALHWVTRNRGGLLSAVLRTYCTIYIYQGPW